jgi:hypothetical protein
MGQLERRDPHIRVPQVTWSTHGCRIATMTRNTLLVSSIGVILFCTLVGRIRFVIQWPIPSDVSLEDLVVFF